MVQPVTKISVTPNLPNELQRLKDLAYNLRWSWDHDTVGLFRRLSNELWFETNRNPVWMLGLVSQARLQEVKDDPSFMAELERVWTEFQNYLHNKNTWYRTHYGNFDKPFIAYFSMEFGLTACLRNYSGGLGILSGDHMKSASDLDLPLVGVGLLYQEGYFEQYLNASGYQQESYPINDYPNLPVEAVMNPANPTQRLTITVPCAQYTLCAYAWKVQVGRAALYLMDANHPDNPPELRNLTDRLYGGDRRTRIRQEILLGIGGIRLLEALGIEATVFHMNEGHSALLALERARLFMKKHPGLTFNEAITVLAVGSVFTIHTNVPAGLERFGFDLIDEHLPWLWKELGLSRDQFHDLGREDLGGYDLFSLPNMALRFSAAANGVSALHGEVSREMWHWMFPKAPLHEVPVSSITNGVHVQTWVSREMAMLFDRYLSPRWREDDSDVEVWKDVERVPDVELWRTHERRRERLVAFARERLQAQLRHRGATFSELQEAEQVLNPDALTIGFARRFATYKRATMIFRDLERLNRLINDPDRPVQFIFAGKAHPHDQPGKEMIQRIVQVANMPQFRRSFVFLENYDMTVARYMLQGADIWLNNPRRPKEASGTSGMKAIYNGGLNASILDGWWAEAYQPGLGWAIGNGEVYPEDQWALQDEIEAQALYNIFETDIIPLFYERSRDNLPREWIRMVKNNMVAFASQFSTSRMVREYAERYYMPLHERFANLSGANIERGKTYADWLEKIRNNWKGLAVRNVEAEAEHVNVGSRVKVTAEVHLGALVPEDVNVQLYAGSLNSLGEIINGTPQAMTYVGKGENGIHTFTADVHFETSGERGLSVRVLPQHPDLPDAFLTGFLTWAK